MDWDRSRCLCGRKRADANVCRYRSHAGRYLFCRCDCGVEWTERQAGIDPLVPVTSDEVIEVHAFLAGFKGSIAELASESWA